MEAPSWGLDKRVYPTSLSGKNHIAKKSARNSLNRTGFIGKRQQLKKGNRIRNMGTRNCHGHNKNTSEIIYEEQNLITSSLASARNRMERARN